MESNHKPTPFEFKWNTDGGLEDLSSIEKSIILQIAHFSNGTKYITRVHFTDSAALIGIINSGIEQFPELAKYVRLSGELTKDEEDHEPN